MFKFLKNKLLGKVDEISEEIEETAETVEVEVEQQPEPEKVGLFSKIKKAFTKKPEVSEYEEEKPEEKEKVKEESKKEEKKEPEPKKEKKKEEPKTEKKKPIKKEEKIKEIKEKFDIKDEKEAEKVEEKREEIIEEIEEVIEKVEEKKAEIKEEIEAEKEEPKEEKKSLLQKLKTKIFAKVISEDIFDKIFWELELILLENNVALEVVDKIKEELRSELVDKPIPRSQIKDKFMEVLKDSVDQVLVDSPIDLITEIDKYHAEKNEPYVICFVGINGSGKTTTIAKVAHMLKENKISSVISASDTFRAAAIQQMEEHATKLHIKLIKHDYGSDPAAVAFDTIKYAKAHNLKSVLIDTAGRLHTNTNLMDEMKKIIRVANPNLVLFIGESITGNDCLEQIKEFGKFIDIDGVILTKADVDEKGGTALSLSYVTQKPILYMGMGQTYDDLVKFDKSKITENLFG